jgi:hypothetical protein
VVSAGARTGVVSIQIQIQSWTQSWVIGDLVIHYRHHHHYHYHGSSVLQNPIWKIQHHRHQKEAQVVVKWGKQSLLVLAHAMPIV